MQLPVRSLIYNRTIAAPISDNLWSENGSVPTSLIILLTHVYVRFGDSNHMNWLNDLQYLM